MSYSDNEALEKRQKNILRQSYKTLFLAAFTIVSFILACIYSLEIEASVVFNYFFACLLLVVLMILLAFLVSLMFRVVKKFRR